MAIETNLGMRDRERERERGSPTWIERKTINLY
jgi:hypothetical protein